jgi:hypothetical protein
MIPSGLCIGFFVQGGFALIVFKHNRSLGHQMDFTEIGNPLQGGFTAHLTVKPYCLLVYWVGYSIVCLGFA